MSEGRRFSFSPEYDELENLDLELKKNVKEFKMYTEPTE